LRELQGNPGKRALPKEPAFAGGAPEPPADFPLEALAEWKRIVPILTAARVLTQADRGVLVAYCLAWSDLLDARAEIEKQGRYFETDKGYVGTHPAVSSAQKAADALVKYSGQLGLTPSARAKVSTVENKEQDPFDEFLSGGGKVVPIQKKSRS